MNRTELIEKVAESAQLDKKTAEAAVAAFVDTVVSGVKSGEKVSIFGFGSFNPKSRSARQGRNPRTGEPVKIAASTGVGFTASSAFKAALNTKSTKKASAKKAAPAAKKATVASKATPAKKASTAASKSPAKKATVAASKAPAKRAPAKATAAAPAKKAPAKATKATPAKKATKR